MKQARHHLTRTAPSSTPADPQASAELIASRTLEHAATSRGLFVVLSGAAWQAGGGAQRPTALARELAAAGYTVLFHNDGPWQRDGRVDGVWTVGTAAAPLVLKQLAQQAAGDRVAIAAMPFYIDRLRQLQAAGWIGVYDCIDDWAAFVDLGAILPRFVEQEPAIVRAADLVTASAPQLVDRMLELGAVAPTLILNAGPAELLPRVDAAGSSAIVRAVYCGSIDNPWLDWQALETLANRPDVRVTMIGKAPAQLPRGAAAWGNYRWLGERPYPEALEIIARHDVGLVPFRGRIAWPVDPLKQHDYRAAGLWTVATRDLHPLERRRHVTLAGRSSFADAVVAAREKVLADPPSAATVALNSWRDRRELLEHALAEHRLGSARRRALELPADQIPALEFVDYCDVAVRIGWACTARCNAKPECPGCCTAHARRRYGLSLYRPAAEIALAFERLRDKVGPLYLVSGWGEGMVDDEVASLLGNIARRNRVDITSNLLFPKRRLKLLPRHGNVSFCSSFHPHLWGGDVEKFLAKLDWLHREEGFPVAVVGVIARPGQLKQTVEWVDTIAARGYTTNALPLQGEVDGKLYPQSFTEEDWAILAPRSCEPTAGSKHRGFADRSMSPRGKQCWAGIKYLYIDFDGRARRCVVDQDIDADLDDLGNLFSEVELLPEPRPCSADVCTCTDLWQYVEL